MTNNIRFEQKRVHSPFVNNAEFTKFAVIMTIHKSLKANVEESLAILDEARKVAYQIEEDSQARVEALKDLASALAYAGRYHEAKQVQETIKNSAVVKAKELRELAAALFSAGSIYSEEAFSVFRDAKKMALHIKHKPTQMKALKELTSIII
ncbi:hypothetical protein RIVM261_058260 [Rivularia sp. IAM M-261]|nr:hypothetical protein CAL7716_033310 [Calothrix sp. PCC 7716]GJD20870.1 hypothetical protein RIVM261_058260 [Rivularia sp. IAM M-261]